MVEKINKKRSKNIKKKISLKKIVTKANKPLIFDDYDSNLDLIDENYKFKTQNLPIQQFYFRTFPISEKAQELANIFDYQPYMIERYIQMFGEQETVDLLKSFETPNPIFIRVNTLKTNTNYLLNKLKEKGYDFENSEYIPYAYRLLDSENYGIKSEIEKQNSNLKTSDYKNEESPKKIKLDFSRSEEELREISWGSPESFDKTKNRPNISNSEEESYKILPFLNKSKSQITHLMNYRKKKVATLGSTHEYLIGKYYIQGFESMLPPLYLNPSESDLVIDMCAAPGSKTTQLAQIMSNKGKIIAVDISKSRINSLIYNLRRCKVYNTIVLQKDATELLSMNLQPDKVLLDAPCSGEGIIRNDPSRKKSKSPEDIKKLINLQIDLLITAVKMVKPGGFVMYSTCSIAPEENEFVVQTILDNYKKVKIVPIEDNFGMPGFINVFGVKLSEDFLNARRYFPHIHDTNGFFLCLLQKNK